MAAFTVRVELDDDPTGEDYDTLHEAMEAEGFSRTIKDSTTKAVFHLPTAEYNFVGPLKRAKILDKAKSAASKTDKDYSVLVTESKGRSWWTLKAV